MRGGGFAPILGAIAGLVVWAAHFAAIYAVTAYACARGAEAARLVGVGLVPAAVLGATVVALLAAGAVLVRAGRRLRRGPPAGEREDRGEFLPWFTAGTTLLAIVAILYEGVPPLIVPACA